MGHDLFEYYVLHTDVGYLIPYWVYIRILCAFLFMLNYLLINLSFNFFNFMGLNKITFEPINLN